MRQALGLFGQRPQSTPEQSGGRSSGGAHMQVGARRHRFVQDGEVPVSVVRGRRDQVASGPASSPRGDERERLHDEQMAERAGREQAERRLAEAQTVIRTLQTRLGHAELERDEAVADAKALREQLSAERAVVERLTAEDARVEPKRERIVERPAERSAEQPVTRVDQAGDAVEPEPVKWWL